MTRFATFTGVLISSLASGVTGATSVRIEGVFVRAGTTSEVTQIEINQPVWLIVKVQDTSSNPEGVAGGYVDVTWDPNVLQLRDAIDGDEATKGDVSALFDYPWTDFFRGWRSGTGSILYLGAGQGQFPPTYMWGDSVPFFTLEFMPIAVGQVVVTLNGRDFGVIGQGSAQSHQSVNPSLRVIQPGTPAGPGETEPGVACFAPALPAVAVLMAGCAGLMATRRSRRA